MGSKVVKVVSKKETESVGRRPTKKREKPRAETLEFSHKPFESALRHITIEGEGKKDIK